MTKNDAIAAGREVGALLAAKMTTINVLDLSMAEDQVKPLIGALVSEYVVEQKIRSSFFFDEAARVILTDWRRRYNEQPHVQLARRIQTLRWKIETDISAAKTAFEKFQKRFAENPLYAFECSEDAVEAAGRQYAATIMQNILNAQTEHGGYDAAVRYATEQAIRGARYPSHSTSSASNRCAEAKTAAFAEYVIY